MPKANIHNKLLALVSAQKYPPKAASHSICRPQANSVYELGYPFVVFCHRPRLGTVWTGDSWSKSVLFKLKNWQTFSPNRPTGRIWSSSCDVRLSVCLSPSHAIFLKCWCENGLDVECFYSLLLIIVDRTNQHYPSLFSFYVTYLIIYLKLF